MFCAHWRMLLAHVAGGNEEPHKDRTEERLQRRFRLVAVGVLLAMLVLEVVVDLFGRLLINPEFRISEVLFGTMLSAILLLLGVAGLERITGRKE